VAASDREADQAVATPKATLPASVAGVAANPAAVAANDDTDFPTTRRGRLMVLGGGITPAPAPHSGIESIGTFDSIGLSLRKSNAKPIVITKTKD
jgi:hypothetical protein